MDSKENNKRAGKLVSRILLRQLFAGVLFLVGVVLFSHRIFMVGANRWFEGDELLQRQLAGGVETWVTGKLSRADFTTGSAQFNGEWLFGTYMMAGMGYGQTALEHPELRSGNMALMEQCIDKLLSPEVRAFDTETWRRDAFEDLESGKIHAAYLGYLNLVLSFHSLLDPDSKYAALNNKITEAMAAALEKSRISLLESYPREVYPVDNCAVIGSIGLHGRAIGKDQGIKYVAAWSAILRQKYLDQKTGLIVQSVDPDTGEALDAGRGSGTCLGLYFLNFADRSLSGDLYASAKKHLSGRFIGYGGGREYPKGISDEYSEGDIDSGPIIFGFGMASTGFMIGGARINNDLKTYERLYATAMAWGAPYRRNGRLNFITGASLGDAILFAMLTANNLHEGDMK